MIPDRCSLLSIVFAFILIVSSPVHASPALLASSNATYQLSAFLNLQMTCAVVDHPELSSQACSPSSFAPPQTVNIYDDRYCTGGNSSCFFSPSIGNALVGQPVTWQNSGSLYHTVTFLKNSTSTPPLNSSWIYPGASFQATFNLPGVYYYHCSLHPWMHGTIVASPNPTTTSPSQLQKIGGSLDGTVGWTLDGLDDRNAVLDVSHNLAISISPSPYLILTPVRLSGNRESSIDLTTRVETGGTASSIISDAIKSLIGSLPVTGGYLNSSSAGLGSILGQNIMPKKEYTAWWVNGPLTQGSTVQLLTGTSSVTGSEHVTVGSIGQRDAWIVSSKWDQSFNVSILASQETSVGGSLRMKWDYDKKGDILLASTINGVLQATSTTGQLITQNPCWPSYTCLTTVQLNVKRVMMVDLKVSMKLTGTNVNLDSRYRGVSSQASANLLGSLDAMSWLGIGIGGAAAAGLVGAGVWYLMRRRKSQVAMGGIPAPATPPQI